MKPRPIRTKEMPESEQPLSEQFRVVAKHWVELDGAARMLEATKSEVMYQMMAKLDDKTMAAREMKVRASPDWNEHVTKTVDARTAANLKKVQLEYIRMKFAEWNSHDANARAEYKMGRQAP